MKKTCCVWCSAIVSVQDTYNDLQHKAVCSPACKAAETIFCLYMSDDNVAQRAHYRELTGGEDGKEDS